MDDDLGELKGPLASEESKSRVMPAPMATFKERIKVVGIGGGGNNAPERYKSISERFSSFNYHLCRFA
jgi:hypothetical protein